MGKTTPQEVREDVKKSFSLESFIYPIIDPGDIENFWLSDNQKERISLTFDVIYDDLIDWIEKNITYGCCRALKVRIFAKVEDQPYNPDPPSAMSGE